MNAISRFFARLFGRRKKVTSTTRATDTADVITAFDESELYENDVHVDARTTTKGNYPNA